MGVVGEWGEGFDLINLAYLLYVFGKKVQTQIRRHRVNVCHSSSNFIYIHRYDLLTISIGVNIDLLKIIQWAHNVKMTSYQRRCDVITSHRR